MLTTANARQPRDMSRINVDDDLELVWWSMHLCVGPEALRAAVKEYGASAEEIRAKLQAAAKTSFSKGGED